MNRHIISPTGAIVSSTMPDTCVECVKKNVLYDTAYICCPLDESYKRLAIGANSAGRAYVCSGDFKDLKEFRYAVDVVIDNIKTLQRINQEVRQESEERLRKEQQVRADRLIHNLKNIYSHFNQELYNLLPQSAKNHSDALEIAKKEISKNVEKAAKTLVRLQKLNVSIKAEISVYEKLMRNDVSLSKRFHNPRDILILVLNTFFGDFSAEGVYVEVDSCFLKAYFDFESVQVALYHLIENAVKYVKPNTTIRVHFHSIERHLSMEITMCSIQVNEEEKEKIFDEGYSGENARKLQRHGKGIGMNRVRRLLELNKIGFSCSFGPAISSENGVSYAMNVFRIDFPLG